MDNIHSICMKHVRYEVVTHKQKSNRIYSSFKYLQQCISINKQNSDIEST